MKRFEQLGYLLVILSLLISTSCSTDDGEGSPAAAVGTFKANIDGADFESSNLTAFASLTTTSQGSVLQLQGSNSDGKAIALIIIGFDDTATYQIGGGANIVNSASYTLVDRNNASNTQIWQAPYDDAMVGNIEITASTADNVQGVFEFTARSNSDETTVTVTKGEFNLNL